MAVTPAFKNFIGNLAVFTTILQFLSGVLVCKQYVVNKTTADSSPLPFLCGALSASVWLLYGVSKSDDRIVFVNVVGVMLMTSYVLLFYKYTFKKSSLIKQMLACIIFFLFIFAYMNSEDDKERLMNLLGSTACYLTLMTVAAPLSKLFHVIRVKNTECLPFPMILMSFFVSALWFLYGYLDVDIFMIIPNIIGAMLAVSQLFLFVIYPNKPRTLSPISAKTVTA